RRIIVPHVLTHLGPPPQKPAGPPIDRQGGIRPPIAAWAGAIHQRGRGIPRAGIDNTRPGIDRNRHPHVAPAGLAVTGHPAVSWRGHGVETPAQAASARVEGSDKTADPRPDPRLAQEKETVPV